MFAGQRGRLSLITTMGAVVVALTGCQSDNVAAPMTSTVTQTLKTALTATILTTDTVTGPTVMVLRTSTKPPLPAVTKTLTRTATVTKTPADVTVTTDEPAASDETSAGDEGASRLAQAEQAADEIQDAASAAGWRGPICDPDVNLHRKEAGQEILSDEHLAESCEANVEEAKTQIANRTSTTEVEEPNPTSVAQTVQDRYEHVRKVLGINRNPTSGEVQIVYACEQGYATADECSVVHEEWDH